MTEQVAEQTLPEIPVTFLDREFWVRMPRPEQLLVWQRTLTQLQNLPPDTNWTASEVMTALERLRKIVDSILVNKADIAWLDDQFLDGTLGFRELAPFIDKVAAAYADAAAPNREARRAKTAKKKAARKVTR